MLTQLCLQFDQFFMGGTETDLTVAKRRQTAQVGELEMKATEMMCSQHFRHRGFGQPPLITKHMHAGRSAPVGVQHLFGNLRR
ncbi:hypothetical protein D3C80_2087640 [compost metagenome]